MCRATTIAALSSGGLPSGVAVIRLSGPEVAAVLTTLTGSVPAPRQFVLRSLRNSGGEILDRGLAVFFPGPHSFTGEDSAEFHVHGSRAVVRAVLDAVCAVPNVVLAEAGDFTRRAFEAGKLDLTAVEGLGDLIAAETEGQRRLAQARADGALRRKIENWRAQLVNLLAEIEARLDFSDESDVEEDLSEDFSFQLKSLAGSLKNELAGYGAGRIVREGFRVVLAGPPNVGKSSLLNALTRSEAAIVTSEAGTTRDVKTVPLDLGGQLVLFQDVAGLRETDSLAEAEGVRRARVAMDDADLVVWLMSEDTGFVPPDHRVTGPCLVVTSKSDLIEAQKALGKSDLSVSSETGAGLEALMEEIGKASKNALHGGSMLISHMRDVTALKACLGDLKEAEDGNLALEVRAEALRKAAAHIGRLTGEIDAEAVLDRLFSGFCIGK